MHWGGFLSPMDRAEKENQTAEAQSSKRKSKRKAQMAEGKSEKP
jgi:hypothetical protein